MLKYFRVPGRLALKLTELGIHFPRCCIAPVYRGDLFEQNRVLVSTLNCSACGEPSTVSATMR